MFDYQIHANELKLRILTTNICNRKCTFCLNDFQSKNKSPMFIDVKVAKQAISNYAYNMYYKVPLQIYFSGGEPTLHPDIVELMSYAHSLGARTTLNTNGDHLHKLLTKLQPHVDVWHLGTYEKSEKQAIMAKRLNAIIQCVYSKQGIVDMDFIDYYVKHGVIVKIFQDFFGDHEDYVNFMNQCTNNFGDMVCFRFTGKQQNRGSGCGDCNKTCITLKGAWLFPDGGTSPCPQNEKPIIYPHSDEEWGRYFNYVLHFHKK